MPSRGKERQPETMPQRDETSGLPASASAFDKCARTASASSTMRIFVPSDFVVAAAS